MSFSSPTDTNIDPSALADTTTKSFNNATKSFNTANIAYIVVCIVIVIGCVITVYFIIKCCRQTGPIVGSGHMQRTNLSVPARSHQSVLPPRVLQLQMGTVENCLDKIDKARPIRYSSRQLEEFTGNYSTKIGSGGFGQVFMGKLPNGIAIAVKVLSIQLNKIAEGQFMAEVDALGQTYHINLVRLLGFNAEAGRCALVYEFMQNGGLDRFLFRQNSTNPGLSFQIMHEIAVGTARGIRYLHEELPKKIIHYDIKPANILLDEKYIPKVADFGLAESLSREKTHASLPGYKGTAGYMAPEMQFAIGVTEKCDVFSYGKLLFEIIGRRKNYSPQSDSSATGSIEHDFPRMVWERYENNRLREMLSATYFMLNEEDTDKAERMCKIALRCIQHNGSDRPKMSDVVRMLEGEIDIAPPSNPFQHLIPPQIPSSGLSSEINSINSQIN